MSNLKTVILILGLISFVSFMGYKVYSSKALYTKHDNEFQLKIKSALKKHISKQNELNEGQLVSLIQAASDRSLEYLYHAWLNKFLIIYIILLTLSAVVVVYYKGKYDLLKKGIFRGAHTQL